MFPWVVASDGFLQMLSGLVELSAVEACLPHGHTGQRQVDRVSCTPGQAEQLLCQLADLIELRPRHAVLVQSEQRPKPLRSFARLLTENSGADVGVFHLRSRVAAGDDQRRTECELQE